MPIVIFFHAVFNRVNGEPYPAALPIVQEQMQALKTSTLLDAASEMIVGLNGEPEITANIARLVIPEKAKIILHGKDSLAENLTIVALEEWIKTHLGWSVLYFHSKGATGDGRGYKSLKVQKPWRETMLTDLVDNWQNCVAFLDAGYEVVCSRFMRGMIDGTQNIVPGNFWWAQSSFLATLPSIWNRDRIKLSGIAAAESRYEAETWIGNGPRLPRVMEFRPDWNPCLPMRNMPAAECDIINA